MWTEHQEEVERGDIRIQRRWEPLGLTGSTEAPQRWWERSWVLSYLGSQKEDGEISRRGFQRSGHKLFWQGRGFLIKYKWIKGLSVFAFVFFFLYPKGMQINSHCFLSTQDSKSEIYFGRRLAVCWGLCRCCLSAEMSVVSQGMCVT